MMMTLLAAIALPFTFNYGGKEYRGFEGTIDGELKVSVDRREFWDFEGASWYTVWFENVGSNPSKILENVKAIDFEFKGVNSELRGIRGDRDTHYRPYVYDLSGWSVHVGFRTDSGRATHDAFPYFNLVHGDGGTLIALGWAGTWQADFSATGKGVRMVGESCLGFRSQLLPSEKMRTAMVVRVPYKGRNDDDAMNLWRRWFLKYVLPKKADGSALKPFTSTAFGANRPKPFVDGSDNEDHTTWNPILEKLVAEKCVPDFHWFDAGWYLSPRRESVDPKRWNEKREKEGHWWQTIGTWELDPVKWPGTSFRDYVRACKAAGMPTFVWFEPERVTMVDDLVKNFGYKKEWALPGSWSIANNLGDKECLAWTLGRIVKMMRENEVEMYREDNNSDPGSAWRLYDERIAKAKGVVRRGAAENLSIQGHYALWDGIIADCKSRGGCPFVDSCASGGGRNDLESMRRGFPMMRSDADRTTTGLRLSMTSTFPKWIPFHGSSSKETVSELESPGQPPDEYASRASFLPIYNFFGQYTINPKFDFARLRHNLEEWKSVNRLLLKDFYVLTPWHHERDLSGWTAFAYHDPATDEALLLAFRQERCPDATLEVTLPFVKDPAKRVRKITLERPRSSYFEHIAGAPEKTFVTELETRYRKYFAEFASLDTNDLSRTIHDGEAADFLIENTPRIDIPDKEIERIFAFRQWSYRKHLGYRDGAWNVSEFIAAEPISCPVVHHLREGRWLKDRRMIDDYTRYWFKPGSRPINGPGSYINAIVKGTLDREEITGDQSLANSLLDAFVKNYETWEKGWSARAWPKDEMYAMGLKSDGMFHDVDDREGTELTLSGNGARVHVNAVMAGEARGIAKIAARLGKKDVAAAFEKRANDLAALVKSKLWNEKLGFFTPMNDEGKLVPVCELHGYTPWYAKIVDEERFNVAWRYLADSKVGFRAPKGLTFPVMSAPGFKVSYEGHACQWCGPSWPYATSIALTALADSLHAGLKLPIGKDEYFFALKAYAAQHFNTLPDGSKVPWIDEVRDPFTGDWIAFKRWQRYTERNYNHSTFCDLVLSGLLGIAANDKGEPVMRPLYPDSWKNVRVENLSFRGKTYTLKSEK